MSVRPGLLLLVAAMLVVCVTSNTIGSEKNATTSKHVLRVKVPPKTSLQTAFNDAGTLDIVVCSQIGDDVSYCDDGYYCCEDDTRCCYSGSVTLSASVCLSLAISVWSLFVF